MKTSLIDRTKIVTLRNGKKKRVNLFDYNMAYAADGYVQLTDDSWIKARLLKALNSQ